MAEIKKLQVFSSLVGAPGKDGQDGFSPTAKVEQTDTGARITMTDKDGTTTADVLNGKDGVGGSGSGAAIIDVTSLPETDINEQAFYRLMNSSAAVVFNGKADDYWSVRNVDTLPEVGEPVSTDMTHYVVYYSRQDGTASAYADETIAAAYSIPVGWYPIDTVFQLGGATFGGYITDINESTGKDGWFVCVEESDGGLYSSKDSIWTRHDNMTIVDVMELPTENIDENTIYRLVKNAALILNRSDVNYIGSGIDSCLVVSSLPDPAPSFFNGDYITACYNVSDSIMYGYVYEQAKPSEIQLSDGWYTIDELLQTVDGKWGGIITDLLDDPCDENLYTLLEIDLYVYANGWNKIPISTGFHNLASGNYSHAEGYGTTASGDYSHAEGSNTTASGNCSHAEGSNTTASHGSSHAEGYGTTAEGPYGSHAEGYYTAAYGKAQHAQGAYNIVDTEDKYAHIVGNGESEETRSNAHTLDWEGNAWFSGTVKIGGAGQDDPMAKKLATEEYVRSAIGSVGSGEGGSGAAIIDVVELPTGYVNEQAFYRVLSGSLVYNQHLQNAYTIYCVETLPETGLPATNVDQTEGNVYYNVADGAAYGYVDDMLSAALSVPSGWYPAATLLGALGFEYAGVITNIIDDPMDGKFRLLLEYVVYSYKNDNWTSHKTIGRAGTGRSAEIFNHPTNLASGHSSHAEGVNTTASGGYSHAEGMDTTASGSQSHAEGNNTTASGDYGSHAEGVNTTASGNYGSHAEGYSTIASGPSSHAEGHHTKAIGENQHVQGKYNIEDPDSKYAHIVGNGKYDISRSNAHTLDWEGNAWYAGTVEGTALILKSPNGTRFQITVDDSGTLSATAITE